MKTIQTERLLTTLTCAIAAGFVFGAMPIVSPDSVTMTQDDMMRTVTINYQLQDAPAIVTVDIQTNGVSIGDANLHYMAGDVNKRVEPGDHALTWRPDKAWPDHKITNGVTAVVTAWALQTPPDYMVVGLVAPNDIAYYRSAEAMPLGVTNPLYKTEYMVMRKIPAANVRWRMGSAMTESGRMAGREMPHTVTLTNDYYMGIYAVTRYQYYLATGGARPQSLSPFGEDAARPVTYVAYTELRDTSDWPTDGHQVGAKAINDFRNVTGLELDLPTDAQWEFACRAGCGNAYYNGTDTRDESLNLIAWNNLPVQGGGPFEVGLLEPNAWGLYDMLGNVWEWCLDWLGPDNEIPDVHTGATSGTVRVTRGGAYYTQPNSLRCGFRGDETPTQSFAAVGFRLCCPAAQH